MDRIGPPTKDDIKEESSLPTSQELDEIFKKKQAKLAQLRDAHNTRLRQQFNLYPKKTDPPKR